MFLFFFFSSRRRHTRLQGDWSSDVCSSDLCRGRSVARRGCDGGARDAGAAQRAGLTDAAGGVPAQARLRGDARSEERRVGKESSAGGAGEQAEEKEGDSVWKSAGAPH